jgi:Lactoylglutathione lyase and related lyases
MLLGFEHVGMTSGNLDRTIDFYVGLLGLDLVMRKRQTRGEVAFLDAGGGMLEIIAPDREIDLAQDVPDGTAGIRHLTLAYDDIDEVVERLEAAGIEIIEHPRLAYNSEILKRVAFCRDPDGIIVELAERAAD